MPGRSNFGSGFEPIERIVVIMWPERWQLARTSLPLPAAVVHSSARSIERNGDLAVTIDDLMQQIRHTERLITVYRNADEVIVGTEDQIYSRRGLINRIVLTAAEIGDQIVNILECRLEAMREELEKLGADHHGEKR